MNVAWLDRVLLGCSQTVSFHDTNYMYVYMAVSTPDDNGSAERCSCAGTVKPVCVNIHVVHASCVRICRTQANSTA